MVSTEVREGATLVHEGKTSPESGAGARLTRLVFTNVESQMQLVAASRPAPTLLLLRSAEAHPALDDPEASAR